MCSYMIQNLREIDELVLDSFLAKQGLNVNTNWVSETQPNTGPFFTVFFKAGQLSPDALANGDVLCNKDAIFGETTKDITYILTSTI